MSELKTKVLIIGSGPAGYSAAIYAARASLEPILVSGNQPGGQLTITTDIENYPGFPEPIGGIQLMEQMEQQAKNVGVKIIDDEITEIDTSSRPFISKGDSGDTYKSNTIILATGASARWLGLQSEEKFKGFGVSACATCDGFFFRGKEVFVIGGGNSAVEEAIYLTNHASKVTVVHRRDELRAEKIMQKRLLDNPKVEVIWDSRLEEIVGEDSPPAVSRVKIKNVKTNEITEHKTDGVFIAIGHKPNTEFLNGQIITDNAGYIITEHDSTVTSVKGIFAAGDVQDSVYRQAITAAGTGCMAALEAEKLISSEG